ncbi:MAG: dCTP deaminase [Candidatus Saccharimonadales bacterium]
MAIYSNKQIRAAIADGHIVCEPFNKLHVSHASLDVTLGHYYYQTEQIGDHPIYNPFDENDVARYFDGPHQAVVHKEWCQDNGIKLLTGIPPNYLVIPIRPGERILGHTHEFFGIRPPGACEVKSRSTWGRNGLAVSFDAGWIDPGYINRLTLEIFNLNRRETMLLPVGERIAQIIFYESGDVEGNYGSGRDNKHSGKYQQGTDLKQLIKHWKPSLMLPRAFLDKREPPTKIKDLNDL